MDCTIRLWDVATQTCAAVLSGHESTVYGVAFSPDGRTLLSGSEDKTVRLWDIASRSCRFKLTGHTSAIMGVAFCPKVCALMKLDLCLIENGFRSCRTGRGRNTTCSQPSSAQWCVSWFVVTTAQRQC
jgi:WD40 repeat protein